LSCEGEIVFEIDEFEGGDTFEEFPKDENEIGEGEELEV
jgi:hypothetical protein